MAASLARFGTWGNLRRPPRRCPTVDSGTRTVSFHGATLDSPYITFRGIGQNTNIPVSGSPGQYTHLQDPTKEEAKILAKYSSSKYLPTAARAAASPSRSWTSTTPCCLGSELRPADPGQPELVGHRRRAVRSTIR